MGWRDATGRAGPGERGVAGKVGSGELGDHNRATLWDQLSLGKTGIKIGFTS